MSVPSVPPQWVKGRTSRQAHVGLPAGTHEDEHGRSGFFGPASHLYRLHAPTDWVSVDGPAAHRAYDLTRSTAGTDLWPTLVVGNQQVSIAWHRLAVPYRPEFKRDADGDELFFVHAGTGVLRTEYGPLDYRPGHYLLVPRGTTYRFEPATATDLLTIEAAGEQLTLPDRGPLGRHAVFDPAIIDVPEAEAVDEAGEFVVVVKRGGHDTRVTYGFHPCDVVGWKGDLAPLRLHVDDIRPVTSARYHLPPSVHTTFVAPGFVVCTFAPRPMESDPEALRLPFFHRNIDYDEVLFYHSGNFFSRAGIDAGMLTWHPAGLHHGPQPGARSRDAEAAVASAEGDATGGVRMADEVAVMVDARRPLQAWRDAGDRWEIEGYVDSWSVEGGGGGR
ncbi:MAG: homogentisate 1,2-dioxygenase [Acidimicrobiia bacterium]|nr:homogentisate 1,2-dioxygenase [Acidimicrobiia bacterium]